MTNWTTDAIGNLDGKVVVVTGGNSGLGFETVKVLAAKGAEVIMASRNESKANAAITKIKAENASANVVFIAIDMANLNSIKAFSEIFHERYDRLDILMNNAGVMAIPHRKTADGFEMQLGTNHLGHFALTGLLLDRLLSTPGSRVVSTTSVAAITGRLNFEDLMFEARRYSRWTAYNQSKLSNMLFGRELQRRLSAAGKETISVLAHPGFSATNLQEGPADGGGFTGNMMKSFLYMMCQPQEDGALPQIMAATAEGVKGDEYYGPEKMRKGAPKKVDFPASGKNMGAAKNLWDVSVELTGVDYAALA